MKMKVIWKPEGAQPREWVFDRGNPQWDIIFATEKATDWPWVPFLERLDSHSAIAWQALLWVLRKRDEQRLRLEWVEIDDWSQIAMEVECPGCGGWINAQSDHECDLLVESAAQVGPEPKKASKKKAGEPDPEA